MSVVGTERFERSASGVVIPGLTVTKVGTSLSYMDNAPIHKLEKVVEELLANNPVGLYKIAQTLEKLGPTVIMAMSIETIMFIRHRDHDAGIQAWIKLQPQSLFTNYRIESANNNEINLFFRVSDLLYISKVAQQATNIMINLRLRDGQPYLNWKMTLQDRNGSSMESVQELGVSLISPDRMVYIKEPRTLGIPHTYILLPNVSTLKPVAERLKSLSKYLTLSANMNGVFKVTIETVNCECEAIFEGLENPQLEGQQPNEDVNEFAHVRIASDDFVSFLNCYHLDPQNVVCSITDDLQLVFYVYMIIDTYQAHEAPIRPIHSPQTIMTCHVPAYYE